jgi:TrmH family RNA methyltransferase
MRPPELITSPANPLLKEVRKAHSRGGLTDSGWCVAETFHLLEEALRSHCTMPAIIAAQSVQSLVEDQIAGRNGTRMIVVPDKLLDAATQGVVALVDPPEWKVEQMLHTTQLVLVIDGVQDPGNLGTILRSAEAFGADGLLLLRGTVNPFNPKAVRASAGSIFRMPFVQGLDEVELVETLRQSGADFYAAVPGASKSLADADLTRPCVIVIGSEGRGVGATMRCAAKDLSIPTAGVESLNAAVSAAILLYEARRQRGERGGPA